MSRSGRRLRTVWTVCLSLLAPTILAAGNVPLAEDLHRIVSGVVVTLGTDGGYKILKKDADRVRVLHEAVLLMLTGGTQTPKELEQIFSKIDFGPETLLSEYCRSLVETAEAQGPPNHEGLTQAAEKAVQIFGFQGTLPPGATLREMLAMPPESVPEGERAPIPDARSQGTSSAPSILEPAALDELASELRAALEQD